MPPALHATLEGVASRLRDARDPWWIITGAAVVLHGCPTDVADVDVLTSRLDARWLLDDAAMRGRPSERYRSALFGRLGGWPLPVEVMAGFDLYTDGAWQRVRFASHEPVGVGRAILYVPARAELAALLTALGRPKDLARLAMLAS